jgi:hypothetical protein
VLTQVMRAFQDTRTFMYGDAESTKLTLLKMHRPADFERWSIEASAADDAIASRLASAGIGAKQSIAYAEITIYYRMSARFNSDGGHSLRI